MSARLYPAITLDPLRTIKQQPPEASYKVPSLLPHDMIRIDNTRTRDLSKLLLRSEIAL